MMRPILYSFRRCPYAMRARLAICAAEIACELREVALKNKPRAMLNVSPKGTVPVLVKPDGSVLEESCDIMMWALHENDPGGWLTPEVETLEKMQALITKNDEDFKPALDRHKYPDRFPGESLEGNLEKAEEFLEKLEERLKTYPFLFGGRISLADMAIFPFIRQFSKADTTYWESAPYPYLKTWLTGLLGRPLFEKVMMRYAPWVPGDPMTYF